MNNIRATHTDLLNKEDSRNWLIETTAFICLVGITTVRSQSICGMHWWIHIGIREGVPEYRRERLSHNNIWSPFYE